MSFPSANPPVQANTFGAAALPALPNGAPVSFPTFEPTAASPVASPVAIDALVERRSPRAGGKSKIAAAAIGVLMLGGGGAFAYTQVGASKSNTPEEAVDSFYRAIANGDLIGIAESLDPGERGPLLDSGLPLVREVQRVYGSGAAKQPQEPVTFKGYKGSFTGVGAVAVPLRDDLAEVSFQGGTLQTTFDLSTIKLPEQMKAMQDLMVGEKPVANTVNMKGRSPFIAHKSGGRWYVSLGYSAAEATRHEQTPRPAVPARNQGIAPVGAATPEQAVSDMMQAVVDGNARRVIELLPPDEFAALHDYAPKSIAEVTKYPFVPAQFKMNLRPKLRSVATDENRAQVLIDDVPLDFTVNVDDVKVNGAYADSVAKIALKSALADASLGIDHDQFRLQVKDTTNPAQFGDVSWIDDLFNLNIQSPDVQATLRASKAETKGSLKAGAVEGEVHREGSKIVGYLGEKESLYVKFSIEKDTFDVTLTTPNPFDGSLSTTRYQFAKECLTTTTNGNDVKTCGLDEILKNVGPTGLDIASYTTTGPQAELLRRFFPSSNVKSVLCPKVSSLDLIRFATVKHDGKWYVSPTRSLLDSGTEMLRPYNKDNIAICLGQSGGAAAIGVTAVAAVGTTALIGQRVQSTFEPIQNTLPESSTEIQPTFDDIQNTLPVDGTTGGAVSNTFGEFSVSGETLPGTVDPSFSNELPVVDENAPFHAIANTLPTSDEFTLPEPSPGAADTLPPFNLSEPVPSTVPSFDYVAETLPAI